MKPLLNILDIIDIILKSSYLKLNEVSFLYNIINSLVSSINCTNEGSTYSNCELVELSCADAIA